MRRFACTDSNVQPVENRFAKSLITGILAFALAIAAAIFCVGLTPSTAYAANGRHVYVVFDDSTSMVDSDGAWCEAQYALECFVAMLGEDDILTIYPMSAFSGENPSKQTFTYYGSDPAGNVQKVHAGEFLCENAEPGTDEAKLWNADTVFKAADAAYDDMKNSLGDSRLIILTDGEFKQVGDKTSYTGSLAFYGEHVSDEAIAQAINDKLHGWANKGANIYYLALGSGVPRSLIPSAETGLTVETCASNDEIVNGIIESCNWAFKRASLAEYMEDGAPTLPLKKVIIFAQGSSARDNLPAGVSPVLVDYPTNPVSTAPSPNTELVGAVATINQEFARGDTTFSDLVNQSGVEVYFEPNAVINIALMDGDGWEYDTTAETIELKAGGGYVATFSLCDPDTKNPLELGNWVPSCSAILELDGQAPIEIAEGEEFSIPEGTGHLVTSATLTDTSGAEVEFTDEAKTVVSDEKTILDWILHFWYIFPILLIIALLIVAALIARKHFNAPRLPEDLYPELYDVYNGEKVATLTVESMPKVTPFFGPETQCFDLVVRSPFRSNVMPQSIILRATDKRGNMVVDNWDELIELAKLGEDDCVKIGNKKVAKCNPDDAPLPLTTASKIKFAGTRNGDEALIELRLKSKGKNKL